VGQEAAQAGQHGSRLIYGCLIMGELHWTLIFVILAFLAAVAASYWDEMP